MTDVLEWLAQAPILGLMISVEVARPNLISEYKRTTVSIDQARSLASAIGYVLDQDSVALVGMTIWLTCWTDLICQLGEPFPHGDIQSELVEKENYDSYTQGLRPGSWEEFRTGLDRLRDRARQIVAQEVRSTRPQSPDLGAGAARRRDLQVSGGSIQSSERDRQGGYRNQADADIQWSTPAPVATSTHQPEASGRVGKEVRGAIHYGKSAGLKTLSGRNFGTGIKGAEHDRLATASDPRIKQRVYFYLPIEGGIPQPEIGLGGNVYQADLYYVTASSSRPSCKSTRTS